MNRKNRSLVWDHFEKRTPGTALCLLCKSEFKYKNNTSNLRDHLKRKHVSVFRSEREGARDPDNQLSETPSQSTRTEYVPSAPVIPSSSTGLTGTVRRVPALQLTLAGSVQSKELSEEKIGRINMALSEMIATDLQPLSVVDNQGFKKFVKELEPRYSLPSRRVLSRSLLPDLYQNTQQSVQDELNSASCVSATTDIWTSSSSTSHMTVTAHFINNEYELKCYVLSTVQLTTNHTGSYLATVLRDIFEQWNIMSKLVAVVTDGGANIKSAVSILGLSHLPCVAHLLNLVVHHALTDTQELDSVLQASRAIVSYFKSSVLASDKLKSVQLQMGQPDLKVKKDVITRWNSVYYMLQRLLQIKEALSASLVSLPGSPMALTTDQWNVIEDCVLLLKPLELMTSELSGQKYPTLSSIIPLVRGIQISITGKTASTAIGRSLKETLLFEINKRLGKVEKMDLPSAATMLDPRFKKVGFGVDSNAENAKKFITEELAALFQSRMRMNTQWPTDQDIQDTVASDVCPDDNECLLGYLDAKVADHVKSENPMSNSIIMFRQYLDQPYEDRRKSPLAFWKSKKMVMEELSRLAEKYLCIPATSVPSERVFSKAGQIMSERRNRLKGKNLDMLLFLNMNM